MVHQNVLCKPYRPPLGATSRGQNHDGSGENVLLLSSGIYNPRFMLVYRVQTGIMFPVEAVYVKALSCQALGQKHNG